MFTQNILEISFVERSQKSLSMIFWRIKKFYKIDFLISEKIWKIILGLKIQIYEISHKNLPKII